MNRSKLYVPNPQKWISFFEQKSKQTGGGGRKGIFPVKDTAVTTRPNSLTVEVVSPAQQTVERAKSELEREDIKPSAVAKAVHNRKRRRESSRTKARAPKKGKKTIKDIFKS